MKRFIALSLAILCAAAGFAQTTTNKTALKQIADAARARAESKKRDAERIAILKGLPIRQILPSGKVIELMEFRNGRPYYMETANVNAAITTRANKVHPGGGAGLNLTGSGVTLGQWDGGTVRTTHQEYAGRIVLGDSEPQSGDHASHVAGTMIASGVNPSAKGMSYAGIVNSFGWNSDTAEMATAAAAGLRLSNHSYGYITGWYFNGSIWQWYGDTAVSQLEDNGFGFYDSTAQDYDNVAYNAPFYLIC
ncbi:MAG: large repetitive protein, partial [Fimbriimonadaceae bacterium]|nr:large repetitive protein [Fimbriimonadaceae bacterium]